MRPTQEQIEAAFRYATRPLRAINESDIVTIQSCDTIATTGYAASQILAAAYREAMAENAELRRERSAMQNNYMELARHHNRHCTCNDIY
jgi:hypothetical protein